MPIKLVFTLFVPVSCLLLATAAYADNAKSEPATFAEALVGGDAAVKLRYRFEIVDDDAFDERAEASTLRTSLSYRTADWRGWSLFLEAENVAAVFDDDDYNNAGAGSLNNGVRGVPVVADPKLTEINQASLRFRGEWLTATVGRQAVNLGDQRFVGAVAWRQNHQTFDAARFQLKASDRTSLDYTFVRGVHRIFGDEVDLEGHLLNAPFKFGDGHQLTAYGYWLDYDDAITNSTATYGLEYKGKHEVSDRWTLAWELEAAQQDDYGDNPREVDTDYLSASFGGDSGLFGFDVTWEVLGGRGDGQRSFQTPLATLHKWNGWADKFLVTPSPGLETLYLRLKSKPAPAWKLMVIYHEFTSNDGDIDYGTEIDAEVVYTSPWKQAFALKFADYEADRFSRDTQKLMLWSSYAF
ncbi:MAG: alginate export family protein [Acidobacteriota bacterium]